MLHINFKSTLVKSFTLFVLCLAVFSHVGIAGGGDSYAIYLNNKLITKQHVTQSSSGIISLPLDKANLNDRIKIHYSHCGVIGKGRSIIVKNDQNQVLKEWKFADAKGSEVSVSIQVKDILDLKKKNVNARLNLYYSSKELPQGRMLASVMLDDKNITKHRSEKNIYRYSLKKFLD